MAEGLVDLARRYVALSDELETVRGEIKRVMLNGGGAPEPGVKAKPNPTKPARPAGGSKPTKSARMHPNAKLAAEAEAKIIALLRMTPGMRPSEIAKQMAARPNTTVQRLERMRERGEVQRDDQGAYAASV
jgi:hypothetical protein